MHVREVGAAAGVSVALVKFYVREGLLHPGVRETANSTSYDESHIRRLRLIRAFVEGSRLSLHQVRDLLDVIDDPQLPIRLVMRQAHRTLARVEEPPSERSLAIVREAIEANGWLVSDENSGVAACAAVLDTAASLGREGVQRLLHLYADAVVRIARQDVEGAARLVSREDVAEAIVLGTVLGDSMLLGMRRMAQEHVARTTIPVPPEVDALLDEAKARAEAARRRDRPLEDDGVQEAAVG